MTEQIKLDDKRAREYFKEDKDFKKKLLTFYGFCLLCIIPFLNFILIPFFAIKFLGYFLTNTRNRVFKPNSNLPNWNDKGQLGIGFKAMVANLIIGIPVNILFCVFVSPLLAPGNSSMAFGFLMAVILFLVPMIYFAIAVLAFVTDFKIKSFFNFKAINYILKNELFVSYISKMAIYFILYFLAQIIAGITVIGIIAVPAIIFIFFAIISDIQAQFIRHAFKIGQKK